MKPLLKSITYLTFIIQMSNAGLWNWVADDFDVLMKTHGDISFSPYVHGDFERHYPEPGYRSEFNAYVDFFEWKGLISNWLISNTTIIERNGKASLKLDRIRYTITPGYRFEFEEHMISGLLLHECIHTISKVETDGGAIWWNSFQIGFGTKSSYHQYLVSKYQRNSKTKFPGFDYNFNVGVFLYGDQSVWIRQNHDYRYEIFYTARVHWGRVGDWGFLSDLNHHSWIDEFWRYENKIDVSFEILLSGRQNLASIYYQYFIHDTFEKDNQDNLGAIGFKIVF